MQDKLYKILKVKIDSINRNIDNLNYLNGELEKNSNDLSYIEEKIDLFGTSNVLAFDSLGRDEFEKILLMLDPSVSEIFQDKTCNYQGIMYIIQGIKQGISLELTDIQKNAIETFIEQMINKKAALEDTIANLNESKKRLPITEMTTLNSELKKYQTIINKLEEDLYIVEIDDIIDALEFASAPLEEKVSIFEFLLKYNASIYAANQTVTPEIEAEDDYSLNEIDVPEFHYEPINIYDDIKDKEVKAPEPDLDKTIEVPKEEMDYSFPTIPNFVKNEKIVEIAPKVEPKIPDIEISDIKPIEIATPVEPEIPLEIKSEPIEVHPVETTIEEEKNVEEEVPHFEVPIANQEEQPKVEVDLPPIAPLPEPATPSEAIPETPKFEDTTSTAELEDIIGKIDAKLKEMELDKTKEQVTPVKPTEPTEAKTDETVQVKVLLANEEIDSNSISDLNFMTEQNVREVLEILKSENLLEIFKSYSKVLSKTLLVGSASLKLVLSAIKDIFGKKEYQESVEVILTTMPILFASENVIDDFLKNINFYKEHKINLINLFDNYPELLIINNKDLENNYNLTKDYKIELEDENVKYLLGNKRVLENLDYYLEAKGGEKSGLLGREEDFNGLEYVKKNPYKLNNITKDALIKLRYATENDQKIYGNKPGILAGEITNPKVDVLKIPADYKKQFFDNEYTFTSLDEVKKIKREIKNKKNYDLEVSDNIKLLDSKYKKDELRYVIDGLTFSRLKTIRLYNFLVTKKMPVKEAMLMALTYNSVIKRDEYLQLETAITNLLEGGN